MIHYTVTKLINSLLIELHHYVNRVKQFSMTIQNDMKLLKKSNLVSTSISGSEPVRLDLVLGLFLGIGIFLLVSLGVFCVIVVVVLCKMKEKRKAEYDLRIFDK